MMKRFFAVAAVLAFPASAFAQPALPPPPPPPPPVAPAAPPAAAPAAAPASTPASDGNYGPHQGWLGISLGLPAGGAPTAGLSYFLSDTGALKLDFGLDFGTKGGTFLPGFSAELGYRMYIAKAGNLSPFVQPGAFVGRAAGGGDFLPNFTMQFNVGLGAEYFFSDHLSVSGQTGLGVSFRTTANTFDTINFATGTSGIYGNLYW
jgi:hypothetical protein